MDTGVDNNLMKKQEWSKWLGHRKWFVSDEGEICVCVQRQRGLQKRVCRVKISIQNIDSEKLIRVPSEWAQVSGDGFIKFMFGLREPTTHTWRFGVNTAQCLDWFGRQQGSLAAREVVVDNLKRNP